MSTAFWLFIIFSLIAIFVLPSFVVIPGEEEKEVEPEPEPMKVAFHGGPYDKQVQYMQEPYPFIIAPYSPTEDDEDLGEPLGSIGPMQIYPPKYAWYTQMFDDEYVYVRDVSETELQQISITGEPPNIES